MTDFMRAMDARNGQRERRERARTQLDRKDYGEFHSELRRSGPNVADLWKQIIERSTAVQKPGERKLQNNGYGTQSSGYNQGHNNNNYYYYGGRNANGQGYAAYNGQVATQASGYAQGQDGYGYKNGNNRYYNNPNYWQQDAHQNYNQQAQNAQAQRYNATFDEMDDYSQTYGDWDNDFGLDPTQFSLSYHRCASVRQFDGEVASSKDSTNVFLTKHFAVFRCCPEKGRMVWEEEIRDEFFCDEDYYGRKQCEYLEEYAEYMKQTREHQDKSSYYRNGDKEEREWDAGVEANETLAEEVEAAYGEMAEQNNTWSYGDVEEEQELFGGRGEGWKSNYGEYMVELEDNWEQQIQQYQRWEMQYNQRKQGQNDDGIVDDQFDKYGEQVASYYDDDYDANVQVNELCGNLYAEAARCDKHYHTYNAKSKQKKYAEAVTNKDLSCDFIDSIVMGNYDEFGYISMWGEAGEMDEQE